MVFAKLFPAQRRSEMVSMRFTPGELKALDRAAAQRKIARAALLRQVVNEFIKAASERQEGHVNVS